MTRVTGSPSGKKEERGGKRRQPPLVADTLKRNEPRTSQRRSEKRGEKSGAQDYLSGGEKNAIGESDLLNYQKTTTREDHPEASG